MIQKGFINSVNSSDVSLSILQAPQIKTNFSDEVISTEDINFSFGGERIKKGDLIDRDSS